MTPDRDGNQPTTVTTWEDHKDDLKLKFDPKLDACYLTFSGGDPQRPLKPSIEPLPSRIFNGGLE